MPRKITPLDINTARQDELEAIEGIGPALAEAILRYRDTVGPFTSVDRLDRVPEFEDLPDERRAGLKVRVAVRPVPGAAEIAPGTRLDLKRASEEQLAVVPGLGPGRAREIVRHRSGVGGFASLDELDELPLLKHLTPSECGWIKQHLIVA